MSYEGTVVCAGADHAQPDGVAVNGDVVDREVKVREGSPQRRDHGFDSLGAGGVVRTEVLMFDKVAGDELVGDVEVALVEAFFDQSSDEHFWALGHHRHAFDTVTL